MTTEKKEQNQQLSLLSEDDIKAIIRPEENLEKWSDFLFPQPRTSGLEKPRKMEWEVALADGEPGVASISVEPSTAHQGYTSGTYDVYLALVSIWERNGRPTTTFNTSMAEICRELNIASNGKNIKRVEEDGNRLLKTNISWTLSYKIDKEHQTVKNQQILDTFDYSSMSERFDSTTKFDKTCVVKFHNKILANLLANGTIPINFSARKNITSPIAKVLYSKVDKILYSTKRPYSRNAANLVNDLNLTVGRYKYKSQRKGLVQNLQKSLNGKVLSNLSILNVEIEETVDGKDWKCTFKSLKNPKKKKTSPRRKLKIVNTEKHVVDDLIAQIVYTVGHENKNKALYRLFAVHYSTDAIYRALSEYKERLRADGVETKPAMFTAIMHRIAHEMGFEWIKDCKKDGKNL